MKRGWVRMKVDYYKNYQLVRQIYYFTQDEKGLATLQMVYTTSLPRFYRHEHSGKIVLVQRLAKEVQGKIPDNIKGSLILEATRCLNLIPTNVKIEYSDETD